MYITMNNKNFLSYLKNFDISEYHKEINFYVKNRVKIGETKKI